MTQKFWMQLFFCKITQIPDHFFENGVTKYGREFRKRLYAEDAGPTLQNIIVNPGVAL